MAWIIGAASTAEAAGLKAQGWTCEENIPDMFVNRVDEEDADEVMVMVFVNEDIYEILNKIY